MAGLVAYYNFQDFHYLRVTTNEQGWPFIGIIVCDGGAYRELAECDVRVDGVKRFYLQAEMHVPWLWFRWSKDGANWENIGPKINCSNLADEGAGPRFTGAFVGVCCQDMSGQFARADFDWFEYREM